MFDDSWRTTEVYYQFPLCTLYGNKEANRTQPYIRDCIRFRTIAERLLFCSPKAHEALRKGYPFLDEMPKRTPNQGPYLRWLSYRYTEIDTPRFQRLWVLMPRLKEIYTKLLLVPNLEWE